MGRGLASAGTRKNIQVARQRAKKENVSVTVRVEVKEREVELESERANEEGTGVNGRIWD